MMNLLSRIGWEARVAMAPAERQFDAPVSLTVAAREVVTTCCLSRRLR